MPNDRRNPMPRYTAKMPRTPAINRYRTWAGGSFLLTLPLMIVSELRGHEDMVSLYALLNIVFVVGIIIGKCLIEEA